MAAHSDSRKRTLEALEKRFAIAKAEIFNKEKANKITLREHVKPSHPHPAPSASPNAQKPNPEPKPQPSPTPKKGNFNFFGYSFIKETEEADPIYAQLSHDVNENLLRTNDKSCTDRRSSVDSILHELFKKGDNGHKYMLGSRSYKIDNIIHLDYFVQGRSIASGSEARTLQIHSKRSKKHMSMKQHKKKGSLDLPQEFHKFNIFKPMREMWNDYIAKLLKSTRIDQLAQCLLGADLHGAFILVVECKIIHFTGTCGIMIRETAEAFGIITEDNKFRVVPKRGSVFVFQVDCFKVTVHGDKLSSRRIGL
ncbi:ribonuclease MRP protein subunit POP4 [Arachis stenosperma]|uniref:ribonuclease MRP protein subunit POP4 n=1 Tax=Arachis stenosperma TaxID=217475 RepID=UPI0025AD6971|nr:ribonuclease MRP protein subunit POP4 [Arachis stenosperma]